MKLIVTKPWTFYVYVLLMSLFAELALWLIVDSVWIESHKVFPMWTGLAMAGLSV